MTACIWLAITAALLCWRRPSVAGVRVAKLPSGSAASAALGAASDVRGNVARLSAQRLVVAVTGVRSAFLVSGIVLAATLGGLAAARPTVGLAIGVVLAACVSTGLAALRGRAVGGHQADLLTAVAMIEAELAAGGREDVALRSGAAVAGPYRAALASAAAVAASGGDVSAMLTGVVELAPMAQAWQVRARSGAALADLLADVRRDLELSAARRSEVSAALAGPRSSAMLLAGLPLLGIALGAGLGADPAGFLLGSTQGSLVLLAGVVADISGVLWTRLLVRRALA